MTQGLAKSHVAHAELKFVTLMSQAFILLEFQVWATLAGFITGVSFTQISKDISVSQTVSDHTQIVHSLTLTLGLISLPRSEHMDYMNTRMWFEAPYVGLVRIRRGWVMAETKRKSLLPLWWVCYGATLP